MPTTPLERLKFLQNGLCFFCHRTIPADEASIEHLVPAAHKGTNDTENLVLCCRTLNGIFGSMSLKEKIKVILNKQGKFICPNASRDAQPKAKQTAAPKVDTKHP